MSDWTDPPEFDDYLTPEERDELVRIAETNIWAQIEAEEATT